MHIHKPGVAARWDKEYGTAVKKRKPKKKTKKGY